MKKLMYLAITFFTFIFSFIAPMKNNFNININNNKIVEKLEPKKAYENAPEKEIDLPGFNKEFKLFFNISTIEEATNFLNTYVSSSTTTFDKVYFIGELNTPLDEYSILKNFFISSFGNKIQFYTIINSVGVDYLMLLASLGFESGQLVYYDSDDDSSRTEITSNEEVAYFFTSTINELASQSTFISRESLFVEMSGITIDINVSESFSNNFAYGYDLIQASAVPGLIGTISSIATGILSLLISLFSSVVAIFWNVSNNTPTFLGVVLLFVVAVPITYWVINFVIGLIKKIRLTRGK